MRESLILYYKEDYQKNTRFIEIVSNALKKKDIELRVIILDDNEENLENLNPLFVINRSRNSELAKHFEAKGIPVFNNSYVTAVANDKRKTYEEFSDIPHMGQASEGQYPYVIKSLDGHGGDEVFLVENKEDETKALNKLTGKEFLRQKLCNEPGKDLRVYMLGNQVVVAMLRQSKSGFKSNYSLGGSAEEIKLNDTQINLATSIANKLDSDYIGIDFIFHNGQLRLNEIEDAVGARMVYENTDIDIVEMFAEYIINEVEQ